MKILRELQCSFQKWVEIRKNYLYLLFFIKLQLHRYVYRTTFATNLECGVNFQLGAQKYQYILNLFPDLTPIKKNSFS